MTFMRGCKEGDKLEKVVLVKVSELVFDSELYPRNKVSWLTAYSYSQAMRAGEVFPPIRVGLFQGKKYVVDGWHRVEAKRLLGEEYVEAVVKRYSAFKDMFVDAVKYNISHGRALSVQEKARIIHKLEELQFSPVEISQIVKVPVDKIEVFKIRVVYGPNGKPVVLKSVVAKVKVPEEVKVQVDQDKLSVRDAYSLLSQLAELLEAGAINFSEDDRLKELAVKIYRLLAEALELTVEAR
jgi:ParB-like chromosome segregation protein Spo0J